jgi:transposase
MLAFISRLLYITVPGGTAMNRNELILDEEWSLVTRFLPAGWQEKAKELGALQRFRRFSDEDDLLRALLIHLVLGCSGRETAVRVSEYGIARISDVAFLKRLAKADAWMRWMAQGVMKGWGNTVSDVLESSGLRTRLTDASCVQSPGRKGPSWRIHYAVELPSLLCDEIEVTGREVGESFKNFTVKPGDLLLGDRGYAHAPGIASVVERGGHVLVRTSLTLLPLRGEDGATFPILPHLRTLKDGEVGDWDVWIPYDGKLIKGRQCAVRKSLAARLKARKRVLRERSKGFGKKGQLRSQTLEAADYVIIFTTLDRTFTAAQILEIYQARWQVELCFKRLKSILRIGNLHNKNPQTARAWLHGKILVAFLTESIILAARSLSPWGYPTACQVPQKPQPVAGDLLHSPPSVPSDSSSLGAVLVHSKLAHNRTSPPGTTPKTDPSDGTYQETAPQYRQNP